jgi:hypothetical protein
MGPRIASREPLALHVRAFLILGGCLCLAFLFLLISRHSSLHAVAWPQGWFNSFDFGIVTYVNQLGNRWVWLTPTALLFTKHNLLKDGPIVLLLWFAFFPRRTSPEKTLKAHKKIAATVSLALFGVVLARIMAMILPFRERPLRTTAAHFVPPHVPSRVSGLTLADGFDDGRVARHRPGEPRRQLNVPRFCLEKSDAAMAEICWSGCRVRLRLEL